MRRAVTRRGFLGAAARAGAGFASVAVRLPAPDAAARCPLQDLPPLDGELAHDERLLGFAARDQGGIVQRRPCAVLTPRSVLDIVRIVRYANDRGLQVAMRGRGHARYGQALVQNGIVIDSRSLHTIVSASGDTLTVHAGASLADCTRAALTAGLALPVTTHCSMLSVGGFLSAGGEARGTHQHGAFIDQVVELDVVTGEGRLVTCSEAQERDLFEMALGGMGQCAIIVRAKLRVMPAPTRVVLRSLRYHTLEPFLRDQERLAIEAVDGRFDIVRASVGRAGDGRWVFGLTVGRYATGEDDVDPAPRLGHLPDARMSSAARSTYARYQGIDQPVRQPAATQQSRTPPDAAPTDHRRIADASLAVWMPAASVLELLKGILGPPSPGAGIDTIELSTYDTRRFGRPLFRVPDERRVAAIWLSRIVRATGPPLEEHLEANARLLQRVIALGGKRYPPYGGIVTPSDWRAHYGDELYQRFTQAKRRYDPRRVLTPGPAVFA